jgi:hypothetical protein
VDHEVAPPPRSYAALIGAGLVCFLALFVAIGRGLFFWGGDLPTITGIPLSLIGLIVIVHALSVAWRGGQPLWLRLAPIVLCAATLLIVWTVPFSRLGAHLDFAAHRTEREALAQRIVATWHGGEADSVPLGVAAPMLSRDDNTVGVAPCRRVTCVLFFTWRPTKTEAAEGYLYVPAGGDPAQFAWYGRFAADPLGGRWWYVREMERGDTTPP